MLAVLCLGAESRLVNSFPSCELSSPIKLPFPVYPNMKKHKEKRQTEGWGGWERTTIEVMPVMIRNWWRISLHLKKLLGEPRARVTKVFNCFSMQGTSLLQALRD